MNKQTVWVFGDQLNQKIGALGDAKPTTHRILIIESRAKITTRRWHVQRAHFIVASMRRFADLNKALTGVDGSILYTIYGALGGVGFLTGYPNMAAVDAARAKMTPEWMAKFLEGSKFGMAGSGLQRMVTKIA